VTNADNTRTRKNRKKQSRKSVQATDKKNKMFIHKDYSTKKLKNGAQKLERCYAFTPQRIN